eukprot:COSAG06_NODE_38320_length_424_cov_92.950769_2_plen_22_part_01
MTLHADGLSMHHQEAMTMRQEQ